jgi:hypothetical protein
MSGIAFALNYPTEFELIGYYPNRKVRNATGTGLYKVQYLEGGWYTIDLDATFVRSCMTTQGPKAWVTEPTSYEQLFGK